MDPISSCDARRRIRAGEALPQGLTVEGSLDLWGCTGLTALPQGLTVEGSLDLRGCTEMTALPEGLSVAGGLWLTSCAGLNHLSVGTDSRGYRFYRVKMRDGMHVIAGYRNFSAAQARAHWAEGTECRALAEACLRGEQ